MPVRVNESGPRDSRQTQLPYATLELSVATKRMSTELLLPLARRIKAANKLASGIPNAANHNILTGQSKQIFCKG